MTVRVLQYEPDSDVIPHAIIWRSLQYCTLVIRDGVDDLDSYKGASFAIGNDIRFDLRVYRGHIRPEVTVTLYLPEDVRDEKRISEVVTTVIKEMEIPVTAVAWRRGQQFQFGKLERSPHDRLKEREARILILKIAASRPERILQLSTYCVRKCQNISIYPPLTKPSPLRGETNRFGRLSSAIRCHRTPPERGPFLRKDGRRRFRTA